jgi:hypothetical protein
MRGGKAKVAASKFSNQLPIDPARAARHVNADDFKVLSKKVKYRAPQWHLACIETRIFSLYLLLCCPMICGNNQKGHDDSFELFPSSRKAEPAAAPAMVRPLASALSASSSASAASSSAAAIPITASALGNAPDAKSVAPVVPAVAAAAATPALKMITPKLAKSMISAPLEMLAFLPNDTGLPEAGAWQQVCRVSAIRLSTFLCDSSCTLIA